jgi:hypothetical protein
MSVIFENISYKNSKEENTQTNQEKNIQPYKLAIKSIANKLKIISESHHSGMKYPLPNELLSSDKKSLNLDNINFYFPGILICREILYNSRIKSSNKFSITMSILIIIHCVYPFMISYYFDENESPTYPVLKWIFIPIKIILIYYLLTVLMLYIETGTMDYRRRLIVMKTLSSMLQPDKTLLSSIYKTINFYDVNTLKSWMTSRRILMDVGLNYLKRLEAYIGTVLIINTFIVIILLLGNFGILRHFHFKDYPVFFMLG